MNICTWIKMKIIFNCLLQTVKITKQKRYNNLFSFINMKRMNYNSCHIFNTKEGKFNLIGL